MIKTIVTDTEFLSERCVPWSLIDQNLEKNIKHLIDTANYYYNKCAGLAFNQIGILKRGILIRSEGKYKVMINPVYIMKSPSVKARMESCLSRPTNKPIKKRRSIKVKIEYYDWETKEIKQEKFLGLEARIVQHEIDHLNGVLI